MSTPLEIFCCYAREDQEMLVHLIKHLTPLRRQGKITIWSDTNSNAGVMWEHEPHWHLESADIILLLISPDFMVSDYCYSIEMERAIERHNEGSASVIPILIRATFWDNAPFAKLHMIPTNAKHVKSWSDPDEAFDNITRHIDRVISERQIHHARINTRTHFNSVLPKSMTQAWIEEQWHRASKTHHPTGFHGEALPINEQVTLHDQNNAFTYQNGASKSGEITSDAVKVYLDKLLGPDARVKDATYKFTADMLHQLGFRYFREIDAYIAENARVNDYKDLSTIAWRAKQGQIMKFETLLLASMGEDFISKYPKEKIAGFKERYGQALRRLRRAKINVGKV